ncbi:hypothetical protein CC56_2652 [Bordetella pertussis H934]|nr:hypothetical protein CC56_2652 [Bordetella pertussis H934]
MAGHAVGLVEQLLARQHALVVGVAPLLLDDIARRIEDGEISDELLTLSECTAEPGADLDRGTHTDVSMRLAR